MKRRYASRSPTSDPTEAFLRDEKRMTRELTSVQGGRPVRHEKTEKELEQEFIAMLEPILITGAHGDYTNGKDAVRHSDEEKLVLARFPPKRPPWTSRRSRSSRESDLSASIPGENTVHEITVKISVAGAAAATTAKDKLQERLADAVAATAFLASANVALVKIDSVQRFDVQGSK